MQTAQLVKRVEQQLRLASRQVVELRHVQDAYQLIVDRCREQLPIDFAMIVLSDNSSYDVKAYSGEAPDVLAHFPLPLVQCAKTYREQIVTYLDATQTCTFSTHMKQTDFKTWFTVPLHFSADQFGFCLIGYRKEIELIPDMGVVFNEFGKDLEVSMLYHQEKNEKEQLEQLLHFQQQLVAESMLTNDFLGIAQKVSTIFQTSVIILDQFYKPLTSVLLSEQETLIQDFSTQEAQKNIWDVRVGMDVYGYIAFTNPPQTSHFMTIAIEVIKNMVAIQFMKQKMAFDVQQKAKTQFFEQLFAAKRDDQQLQARANFLNVSLDTPHHLALLHNEPPDVLLSHLKPFEQDVLFATVDDQLCLLYPISYAVDALFNVARQYGAKTCIVSHPIQEVAQYRQHYLLLKAALPTMKEGLHIYDELNIEPLLFEIQNESLIASYLEKTLGPLLGTHATLLETLHMYLQRNGNATETASALFIHRSTLLYRLEKIEQLLTVSLNDAETRFSLFFAIKLWNFNNSSE